MEALNAKGAIRAGRYVHQATGYRAFLPAPLPPDPPLHMNELQALLAEASHALGRLDGSVLTLPDPDLFFRTPIINVKKVQTITKTEFPAANQLVQRLVQLGVLKEVTGQARNRQFRFEEYVQLFAKDTNTSLETGN